MMLPLPVTLAVQQGLELLLKLDPELTDALGAIDGKVICFDCRQPTLSVYLLITDGTIQLLRTFDAEPDTTISGTLAQIVSLQNGNDALYRREVTISGDMQTADQLREIIAGIDVELEELLAPFTGDSIAHQLGRVHKEASSWLSATFASFTQNSSEYLQEESRLVAANAEIKHFCNDVDSVRSATDRLEARIKLIEQSRETQ